MSAPRLTMSAASSVLVLVDYQQRLMPVIHEGGAVLAAALRLAQTAAALGVRVVGTEQNPERLGPNDAALRSACEQTLPKRHFDACRDGLLQALAPDAGREALADVVIAGCEAHVCLLQTALGLLRHGHRVWVVDDACGSRAPADRDAGLQRLQQAGAVRVTTEMVLFEWVERHDHPAFKTVLDLVKSHG